MTFVGFDPEDGAPQFDTKEAAIERARMMIKWGDQDPDTKIMVKRDWAPLWFAHAVRETWFEGLAYYEVEE